MAHHGRHSHATRVATPEERVRNAEEWNRTTAQILWAILGFMLLVLAFN